MFSQEINGYSKDEVDSFISQLRANYEAKLMSEKLKALESEKKYLDLKNQSDSFETKEKNILNALSMIEKAKKFQEEGSRNFSNLIMDKIELLFRELNLKFPQLQHMQDFQNIMDEFESLMKNYKENINKMNNITRPIFSENDSMRLLLNKMQDYKKVQDTPKEVHITTNKPTSLKEFPVSESGFNFDEALHPTEDLSEIMKAFDFYND